MIADMSDNVFRTLIVSEMACVLLLGSVASAKGRPDHPYRDAVVDMPVSLARGTVRTPEFSAKHKIYFISIEAQWLLPTVELRCKMGFGVVPPSDHCKSEVVLGGKWRVLEGDRIVAQGSIERISREFEAGKDYLRRYIGYFNGESKHRYTVEVTFTEDGSSLNATNPRLIVSPPDFAF